jgi:hypothetical protein
LILPIGEGKSNFNSGFHKLEARIDDLLAAFVAGAKIERARQADGRVSKGSPGSSVFVRHGLPNSKPNASHGSTSS